jgi:hypothetical protein
MDTEPELGRSSVPTRLSSVDFPEPDGPTMNTNSPFSIANETSRSATTSGS